MMMNWHAFGRRTTEIPADGTAIRISIACRGRTVGAWCDERYLWVSGQDEARKKIVIIVNTKSLYALMACPLQSLVRYLNNPLVVSRAVRLRLPLLPCTILVPALRCSCLDRPSLFTPHSFTIFNCSCHYFTPTGFLCQRNYLYTSVHRCFTS